MKSDEGLFWKSRVLQPWYPAHEHPYLILQDLIILICCVLIELLCGYWTNKKENLMEPPFVAYKRDVSLRNMMLRSTDDASSEQPGSRACQRPRLNTGNYFSSVADTRH